MLSAVKLSMYLFGTVIHAAVAVTTVQPGWAECICLEAMCQSIKQCQPQALLPHLYMAELSSAEMQFPRQVCT